MTFLAGVVGHPISHSISPAMHNAALAFAGIDASYDAFDVAPLQIESFLSDFVGRGLNVTIPHKEAAARFARVKSDDVARSGSANTLLFPDRAAHSTDGDGLVFALSSLEVDPDGADFFLFGAGGAGRAAAWKLASAGARRVWIYNRNASRAKSLVDALEKAYSGVAVHMTEVNPPPGSVFINASSLGLDGISTPTDLSGFDPSIKVLDMVYPQTPLVRAAGARGMSATDGTEMAVGQAVAAFELMWQCAASPLVMRTAAMEFLSRRV